MKKRNASGWGARDWSERIADATKSHAARVVTLLQSRDQKNSQNQLLERPGIKTPTITKYATTASPENWAPLSAGRPVVNALLDSISDGRDRVLFGWPERPGNGFTLAALALREARATGRLSSATIGIWPWRPGLMRAARSVLVHPEDIAMAALAAVNDQEGNTERVEDGLAHRPLNIVELRLKDLLPRNAPRRVVRGRQQLEIVVRSPTLVETTAVFAPAGITFPSDTDQILRRVRNYTFLREAEASYAKALGSLGNPATAPFALLGLPIERNANRLIPLLTSGRIAQHGLDAVVIDLTRPSKAELGDQWERRLTGLLESLDSVPGRRPPVVVVCEDAFSLKGSARAVRDHGARLKPRRQAAHEVGIYLTEPGYLGREGVLPAELQPVDFKADIKDASLVQLREMLVNLGRRFREVNEVAGARAVSRALTFLRRVASLPLGLEEARRTASVLFDADDDHDANIRAMFLPKMALAPLAEVSESSSDGGVARKALQLIEAHVEAWQAETPVSAKLTELLSRDGWSSARTMISVPGKRIVDVLMASDRAVAWECAIVDHDELAAAMRKGGLDRVVVTGATTTAIRALLTSTATPSDVVLLGDASGAALLAGELAPLIRLTGFAAIGVRALAMSNALKRGGLDERLDAGETEFRLHPIAPTRDIDLTREGGAYAGEKILISTSSHCIAYRPPSDVLLFTAGEIRPFQPIPARNIQIGDEVLVLDEPTRDRLRDALAASRTSLEQMAAYHKHIASLREGLPGAGHLDKAREVFRRMREIDPSLPASEVHNICRWLKADLAEAADDGSRQPGAARDWVRFKLFMQANGVDDMLAQTYWRFAIVPTRSYRLQEGFQFNQRVVQFVLDPESFAGGLRKIWLSLLEAVDAVERIDIVKGASRE